MYALLGAGLGTVDVGIVDPQGKIDTVKPIITRKSEDVWYVEYTALITGLHSVNVFFAGKSIPKSPFAVGVSPGTSRGWLFVVPSNSFCDG